MSFYIANLGVLIILNVALIVFRQKKPANNFGDELEKAEKLLSIERLEKVLGSETQAIKRFRYQFLVVYALAVAADWLQGSFIYTLYKVGHQLSEGTVAALFTTGFFCGAISATFAGHLADKYGRKKACLAYCVIYSLSCLTVLFSDIRILFLGRALGGVSTTLLFSVFEAWMVTELRRQNINNLDTNLSDIFGTMATLNGIVAIISGITSEVLVWYTGDVKTPFMASIVCLFAASQCILKYWDENFGETSAADNDESNSESAVATDTWGILQNSKITTLGLTSCFFEGSMYVLVYFWSQAIISARKAAGTEGTAPFGIIFATFMCSLMLGSWTFKQLTRMGSNVVQDSSFAIQAVLCISASSLCIAVISDHEYVRFWSFCLFEFCIGLYLPSMGSLKGSLISDGSRGKIYGLMRLPLNTFVVIVLSTIGEGNVYRENRFMLCGVLMLLSAWMMRRHIN